VGRLRDARGVVGDRRPGAARPRAGLFGVGAAALAAIGRSRVAQAFAVMAAVHLVLTFLLEQR
jgi:hypothetical protein